MRQCLKIPVFFSSLTNLKLMVAMVLMTIYQTKKNQSHLLVAECYFCKELLVNWTVKMTSIHDTVYCGKYCGIAC